MHSPSYKVTLVSSKHIKNQTLISIRKANILNNNNKHDKERERERERESERVSKWVRVYPIASSVSEI